VTDPIELTRALIRIDTAGGGERTAAELLAPVLSAVGMRVEVDEVTPGRANLIARCGDHSRPPLALTGHLDTVRLGAADWTIDPLGGEIVGGRIVGRGASDMKAGVAALVVALERHAARRHDSAGLLLLLTAGEETGCEGARRLVVMHELPKGGPLLVAEPTSNRLVPGHKGALWLQITAHGCAAHGSRPDLGESAITPLARLAVRLADEGLPGAHPVMGRVTVNVGTFSGGTQINLVPSHALMTADIRLVPSTTPAELMAMVRSLAGNDVDVEPLLEAAAVYSSPEGTFPSLVAEVVAEVTGVGSWAAPATYFTDASVLSGALGGAEVVILGPGDSEQAHTVDESCSIDRIHEAVEIYEQVLDRWCDQRRRR